MSEFSTTLLRWFRENRRELPWRDTTDPYAIWLSEVILQQTRIQQGWDYWERFMQRWPTVESLAEATEDEVLLEWQGLGYYSRARNLHQAARQVVAMGGFPRTLEGIRSLKGVGDYTAAAIGSFAFGLRAAVVDGNVYRVLSRHFGIDTPINSTAGKHEFATLAHELLPTSLLEGGGLPEGRGDSVSNYNQAIMDFGATLCTPQSPGCADCPLQHSCVALQEGRVEQLPVKLRTLKVRQRHLTYIYIRCQGQTAIRRRGEGDIWQGLYEPLLMEGDSVNLGQWLSTTILHTAEANSTRYTLHSLQCLKRNVRHVLTHRVLLCDFYLLTVDERPALPPDYFWIDEADIDRYALPRLVELLLETLPE